MKIVTIFFIEQKKKLEKRIKYENGKKNPF